MEVSIATGHLYTPCVPCLKRPCFGMVHILLIVGGKQFLVYYSIELEVEGERCEGVVHIIKVLAKTCVVYTIIPIHSIMHKTFSIKMDLFS